MIVVTVQYTDKPQSVNAWYSGGFGIQFFNVAEAKLFARAESASPPDASLASSALTRVYNDGVLVEAWENGTNITP